MIPGFFVAMMAHRYLYGDHSRGGSSARMADRTGKLLREVIEPQIRKAFNEMKDSTVIQHIAQNP